MRFLIKLLVFVIIVSNIVNGSANAEEILRLATTTSTYETGLLDHILTKFEAENNCKVHIISVGTGKAIRLGANGDVDIILVHARELEEKFIRDGNGVNRRDVMYNDFVILGPQDDPAGIRGLGNVKEGFRNIQRTKSLFISRGDNSGTHNKELKIWKRAGIDPAVLDRYLETGQGMSQTLRIADEKNAYCLVDRGSYLFNRDVIRLSLLLEGDPILLNPYGIIAVSPYKYPHVKYRLAMALIAWMTSPECQKMIADYKKDGNTLYYPNSADQKKAE